MIKQFTSILLIITVNILFLTHAIIPHHHHGGIPHFTIFNTHHQFDINEEEGCCCSHEDTKTTQGCDDGCAFEQSIDIISETKEDFYCSDCSFHKVSDYVQAILFALADQLWIPEKEPDFRLPPYLISYHSIFASHSLGLRAPPVA